MYGVKVLLTMSSQKRERTSSGWAVYSVQVVRSVIDHLKVYTHPFHHSAPIGLSKLNLMYFKVRFQTGSKVGTEMCYSSSII